MQQRLFICPNCGRDTITQPHHENCPVFSLEEIQRQTYEKTRELGMTVGQRFALDIFGLPHPTGDP